MLNWLIGFRKFTIVLLAITLATVFLLTGHIPGSDYAKVLGSMVVGFVSSNIGEHLINAAKEWIKTKKE